MKFRDIFKVLRNLLHLNHIIFGVHKITDGDLMETPFGLKYRVNNLENRLWDEEFLKRYTVSCDICGCLILKKNAIQGEDRLVEKTLNPDDVLDYLSELEHSSPELFEKIMSKKYKYMKQESVYFCKAHK